MIDVFAELTLESRDRKYLADPEGNVGEVWDFFSRGDGAREGVDGLR